MKAIVIYILLSLIYISASSQQDSSEYTFKFMPSFRIKTELVSFSGLNPNLYCEYQFNKNIALNLGFLYHFNGIIWTAPYLLSKDKFENDEWWHLKGIGLDFGIKYYTKSTKYYSLKIKGGFLKYNGSVVTPGLKDSRPETVYKNSINIQFLKGFEYINSKHGFKELFFGIGLMIINKTYTYWIYNTYPLPPHYNIVKGKDIFAVPTFHFGYNIGFKTKS